MGASSESSGGSARGRISGRARRSEVAWLLGDRGFRGRWRMAAAGRTGTSTSPPRHGPNAAVYTASAASGVSCSRPFASVVRAARSAVAARVKWWMGRATEPAARHMRCASAYVAARVTWPVTSWAKATRPPSTPSIRVPIGRSARRGPAGPPRRAVAGRISMFLAPEAMSARSPTQRPPVAGSWNRLKNCLGRPSAEARGDDGRGIGAAAGATGGGGMGGGSGTSHRAFSAHVRGASDGGSVDDALWPVVVMAGPVEGASARPIEPCRAQAGSGAAAVTM